GRRAKRDGQLRARSAQAKRRRRRGTRGAGRGAGRLRIVGQRPVGGAVVNDRRAHALSAELPAPMPTIESLFSLKDRVAIVTGGSRGIGGAIAELFALAGERTALVARERARLAGAAEQMRARGFDVLACACDVSVEAEVSSAVQQVLARFGQVDILV